MATLMAQVSRTGRCFDVRRGRAEGGFTLIEVLIAAVVVSMAVVGAVGLQVAALQSLRSALEHAAATHLAADLAERLLAMPANAAAHACAPCDAAHAALAPSAQLSDWLAQVQSSLPAASAAVSVDAGNAARPRRVHIALGWGSPVSRHEIAAALQDSVP
jgi:prepilin-type N-terminal cleavage/methylation domain-containing protein